MYLMRKMCAATRLWGFLPICIILGNALGLVAVPVITVINLAVGIIALVFLILGIINACSGEPKKLPLIGGITILK